MPRTHLIISLGGCLAIVLALTGTARPQGRDSSKPYLLVASAELSDPYFQQSVVLMLPQREGALVSGLIINKPTKVTVASLFPQSRPLNDNARNAYFGGPVGIRELSLIFRSSKPPNRATLLFQDMYLTTDASDILAVLKSQQPAQEARLFLGRAQWTPEQLAGEMMRSAWHDVAAEPELVFSQDPGGLWKALVQRAQWQRVSAGSEAGAVLLGPARFTSCWGAKGRPLARGNGSTGTELATGYCRPDP